jgi:hemerythrin-like domain-containing protein
MQAIAAYLDQDHRRCDDMYNLAEAKVASRDWHAAAGHFASFLQLFGQHLDKEERVLFPQLDRAIGNACGPTSVMRFEHKHMRSILHDMQEALDLRDHESFFDHADALRMLMRQHNLKEEGILYPMADRALQDQADAVIASMQQLDHLAAAAGSLA